MGIILLVAQGGYAGHRAEDQRVALFIYIRRESQTGVCSHSHHLSFCMFCGVAGLRQMSFKKIIFVVKAIVNV